MLSSELADDPIRSEKTFGYAAVNASFTLTASSTAGCLLRNNLPSPWRALPAVAFGVVLTCTLIVQLASTNYAAQDLAILSGNLLFLAQIAASLVLDLVAFRVGSYRRDTTAVL